MPDTSTPYGTPHSSRPDFYNAELGETFEIKRYDLATLRQSLINNTAGLAAHRKPQLPAGARQRFEIDLTGQQVTEQDIDQLRNDIVIASEGALTPHDLEFRTD